MTTTQVASRRAAPTIKPTTGNNNPHHLDPVALHGDACNALAMALHYLRGSDATNVRGASRKAVQALSALRRLQSVGG